MKQICWKEEEKQ